MMVMTTRISSLCWLLFLQGMTQESLAFAPLMATKRTAIQHHDQHHHHQQHQQGRSSTAVGAVRPDHDDDDDDDNRESASPLVSLWSAAASQVASLTLAATLALGTTVALSPLPASWADEVTTTQSYDGFAEYAKDNQMEQSDVGCFVNKCGLQTKALFANPRGIKGVTCLGRCKGEQACATRCFAEFGSPALDDWLSCTIEENECVKVPKNLDNSAEELGFPRNAVVRNFDPKSLEGTWYKTDGLNPNYDMFDCQTNTFQVSNPDSGANELDMGIFLRIARPDAAGGGFWENALTEHMVVDGSSSGSSDSGDMTGRTMHTAGKMYGLEFSENWFILGESDGSKDVPPFKLVAYKGHTLQGNYEGAFVYAKTPVLSDAAVPAVREAAQRAGLNFDEFNRIDNTCPAGDALNDATSGTGTSTADWIDLIVGEGGVIDWISPGWRGEYRR